MDDLVKWDGSLIAKSLFSISKILETSASIAEAFLLKLLRTFVRSSLYRGDVVRDPSLLGRVIGTMYIEWTSSASAFIEPIRGAKKRFDLKCSVLVSRKLR